jgi:integrase
MALRATSAGHKSFVLIARYPLNPTNPTRRALGDYGALTLEEARNKARAWLALIQRGVDPKIEEARQAAGAQRRQAATFAVVAEQFLTRYAVKLAKAGECRRVIETEFIKRWANRPIAEIMPEEVAAAIRVIARRAPGHAHNCLGYIRRLFGWAIGTHEFGLTASPAERLKPTDLIGRREVRQRVLIDSELRAVWDATEVMGFPYGPLIKMLILTGQRLKEVGSMVWPEIEVRDALWTIPVARMKGGRAHEVPLTGEALSLLESLPRFNAGQHVFTSTGGMKAVDGYGRAKVRIDGLCGVGGWTFHDLRRTVRTHLSALPVTDTVRELVIAHARPGLHKVYDQHSYRDEKRQCLEL